MKKMEAASDVKLCSKCKKICVEPRSLTCFHNFCLQCLLRSIEGKGIKSAKTLVCPVCNEEYVVPKEGLRRNEFVYRLVKEEKSPPSSKAKTLCKMCPKDKENPECKILLATSYCIECEKEMCDLCNKEHSGENSNKTHRVFGLGRQDDVDEKFTIDSGYDCQEHSKKQVELYCKRCKAIICMFCFAETHKSHDCVDLNKYRKQLRDQIKKNCEDATSCLKSCNTMKDQLDAVEREFLESATKAKVNIDRRCKELKQLIDIHARQLNEELKLSKASKEKQIYEHRKKLNKLIDDLKTFKAYCSELASKGTSEEITQDIAWINDRKAGLQRLQEKQAGSELGSMKVFFRSQELNNYEQDVDNIVGSVEVVATRVMKHTVILDLKSDEVLGVAKLKETLYVLCRSLSSISIHVANDFDPERSRKQAPLTEVSSPIDMVASELNNCLYISDRGNKCIWKLAPDLRLTRWMSRMYQPMTMSISTQGHVIMVRNTNPPVLDVYGSRGELFDQYRIPLVLQSPKHVVETSTGDFVVLHKFRDFEGGGRMSWGVSRMNTDGKITCRFIPNDVSQMFYRPRRLSIDEADRVFVVDPGTARLTILGSNLNWIQEFSTNGCDKIRIIPLALCYDKRMKCLLVGDKFSGVFMLAV